MRLKNHPLWEVCESGRFKTTNWRVDYRKQILTIKRGFSEEDIEAILERADKAITAWYAECAAL